MTVLAGCSRDATPKPDGSWPNVVLIVPDTLRGDHLGCYGYDRPTSPRIDALAAKATRYSRTMASSPWTVPSHASMFTGLYAFEHGAHTLKDPNQAPKDLVTPLHEDQTTLAEVLRQAGYATGAVVANAAYLDPRFQLNQGFTDYHVKHVWSPQINTRVFEWLDAHPDKPFFLFVNYMDTHRVYNTTPRPSLLPTPAVQDQGELLDALIDKVMPGDGPIPADLAQKVIDQYDTAVANVDASIGALLDKLVAMGVYDNTVVIVTSDHGEYFGEHHLVEHSKDVYQPALFVPLIVKAPRQTTGQTIDTLIGSTDLPHMILSQLPPALAAKHLPLFPDAPGNHPILSENYYSRARDLYNPRWGHRFDRVRTAIYDWPYKYIHSSDSRHELYDLQHDPAELTNLVQSKPDLAQRLARDLADFKTHRRATRHIITADKPADIDDELMRKLQSLGYTE